MASRTVKPGTGNAPVDVRGSAPFVGSNPAPSTPKHISDATLRVRDVLYEGLLLRCSEEIARERANNLATAVMETLAQMADERRMPGAIPQGNPVCECPPGVISSTCAIHGYGWP